MQCVEGGRDAEPAAGEIPDNTIMAPVAGPVCRTCEQRLGDVDKYAPADQHIQVKWTKFGKNRVAWWTFIH